MFFWPSSSHSSVNSKRAKTKQISTKKKVSWVCVSSKPQNFEKTMKTKKEQDLGKRKEERTN
jgi:hypothetical protein